MLAAWAACAEHDPASEEAAAALVRGYFAAGQRELAVRAYERCRAALGELGLGLSPWLEEVYATAAFEAAPPPARKPRRGTSSGPSPCWPPRWPRTETRILRSCATWPAAAWPR